MDSTVQRLSVTDRQRFPIASYSLEGRVARGKLISKSVWTQVGGKVCSVYKQNPDVVGNSIDLVALVASSLTGDKAAEGLPLLILASINGEIGSFRYLQVKATEWQPKILQSTWQAGSTFRRSFANYCVKKFL